MARILIIEDEASIMLLLKRILAAAGHEMITASDGGEASRIVADKHLDLILSDLSMPGAPSGMDLIRLIRTTQPDCPLVVVSGYSSSDTMADCRQIGITEFLPKPFEIGFIRSFVDGILKRAHAAAPAHH